MGGLWIDTDSNVLVCLTTIVILFPNVPRLKEAHQYLDFTPLAKFAEVFTVSTDSVALLYSIASCLDASAVTAPLATFWTRSRLVLSIHSVRYKSPSQQRARLLTFIGRYESCSHGRRTLGTYSQHLCHAWTKQRELEHCLGQRTRYNFFLKRIYSNFLQQRQHQHQ
jgi:hypothetical protein